MEELLPWKLRRTTVLKAKKRIVRYKLGESGNICFGCKFQQIVWLCFGAVVRIVENPERVAKADMTIYRVPT